ncbi:hypothetical protein [Streptomyces sp. NBC_00503]|uniref:hypothetical protein n=1 Tax=Streptomyces sp. NBC_00503 TaxID=2903659 RepID=UPI002E802D37|nr:hypothetical protein [Streptomyces sp. NBC_00503]WUD81776.1 hypothetical protein OG490_15235 [Streptomyces sp. NBC_00503]
MEAVVVPAIVVLPAEAMLAAVPAVLVPALLPTGPVPPCPVCRAGALSIVIG